MSNNSVGRLDSRMRDAFKRFASPKVYSISTVTADKNVTGIGAGNVPETGAIFENTGAAGTVTLTMSSAQIIGTNFSIAVVVAQEVRLVPNTGGTFIVNGAIQTADKYISVTAIGDKIDVIYLGGTNWLVQDNGATVTVEA